MFLLFESSLFLTSSSETSNSLAKAEIGFKDFNNSSFKSLFDFSSGSIR